jgi:hypothetical protein
LFAGQIVVNLTQMAEVKVKLVEISETVISIQNQDATFYEHLVTLDEEKLEAYKTIQRDFQKMQNELLDLINSGQD